MTDTAIGQVHQPADLPVPGQGPVQTGELFAVVCVRRNPFQQHMQLTTTGQAQPCRLLGGDAVLDHERTAFLIMAGLEAAILQLLQKILFYAAAGDGTDQLSIRGARHHGADRARG